MKTLTFENSENLYFTSDLHLGHANIIQYCNRPFDGVHKMDLAIIANWNDTITDDDIVFILGDFCWRLNSAAIKWYINELKGRKILILGNHDKSEKVYQGLLEKVYDGFINIKVRDLTAKEGYQRLTLCHYPMLSWYQSHRGAWQLFGHMHNETLHSIEDAEKGGEEVSDFLKSEYKYSDRLRKNQYDVGVDGNNFTPLSYEKVKKIILKNLDNSK